MKLTLAFFLSVKTKIIFVSFTIPYIAKKNTKIAKKLVPRAELQTTELPGGILVLKTHLSKVAKLMKKLFSLESTAEIINRNI